MHASGLGLGPADYPVLQCLGQTCTGIRYSIYTGSTVHTTPVTCSAKPYTGNVADQTTSTVTVLS
jgi:hypothetical protein